MKHKNMLFISLAFTACALVVGLTVFNSFGKAPQVYAKTVAEPAAQFGSGTGSNNPLGQVKVTRAILKEGAIAGLGNSDVTDNVEIGWELVPSPSCAVTPTAFDVTVTLNRLGNSAIEPQSKTLRVSGAARSANLVFSTRFVRKVKSMDVKVKAVADLQAEGKTSKNF
jgi:hypothetical protein